MTCSSTKICLFVLVVIINNYTIQFGVLLMPINLKGLFAFLSLIAMWCYLCFSRLV